MNNPIIEAAREAAMFHATQTRRNGTPYIRHPGRVAARVMCQDGMSEQAVVAAFLHDCVEDTAKNEDDANKLLATIKDKYGKIVGDMVGQLTNPSKWTQASRAERKAIDRRHLSFARAEVKRIKLIDRIDNLQEILTDIQTGQETALAFAAMYVVESRQLLEEALAGADPALEAELDSTIKALGALILKKDQRTLTTMQQTEHLNKKANEIQRPDHKQSERSQSQPAGS